MATLIVLAPPAAGTRLTIQKNRHAILGRDPTCDLILDKQSISRFHAQVHVTQGQYYLEDMKSTNGTFLNGRKVKTRVTLKDGDRIVMHDIPIAFFLSDDVSENTETTVRTPVIEAGRSPLPPTDVEIPITNEEMARSVSTTSESAFRSGNLTIKGRLKTLIEIAQDLGSTLEIKEILPNLLDLVFRMFPAAIIGEIHLVGADQNGAIQNGAIQNGADQKLVPVAMKHGREADSTDLTGAPFNLDLIERVFRSSRGMIQTDGTYDSEMALDELQQSIMCVPILAAKSEPVGVILIETDDSSYIFSDEDLELLSAVAVLAGQAIGYSRAHEIEVQHDATMRQLETARQIQLGMLPRTQPDVRNYAFHHYYSAAEKVGGDYYFYEMLRDGRVILGIADASGKGLTAALNIARFAGEVRLRIATSPTLKSALSRLNQFVIDSVDECVFITTCLCVLDPQSNLISIANAGHLPPLLKSRANRTVKELVSQKRSFPLGISPDFELHPWSVQLEPGDQVVLFTDGITEAMDTSNELYTVERLSEVVHHIPGNISQLVTGIANSVNDFRQGRPANDDMTMVAFERLDDLPI